MAAILPDSDSEDELPPCWEERATTDGNVYYVNHTTKATQWTHPRTGKKKVVAGELPFGWERQVNAEGTIFYVDHTNHRTTYADPRLAFAVEEKEHPGDFRQRFDASSTALQVLHGRDLSSKVAIITGANCGIGYETARSLALHGSTVIFACRSVSSAEEAIGKIRAEGKNIGPLESMELDLASLHSVRNFATAFKLKYSQLDMLVLNAGVFGLPFGLTEDGYETHFQVNHLSHFYLTLLLQPHLQISRGARVVFVSSESHRYTGLSAPLVEERLSPGSAAHFQGSMLAYNDSKFLNVLIATEMARRWAPLGIAVNSLHPGNIVSSNLSRNWWAYRLLFALVRPFTKSLQQAASTSIYVATAPELTGVSGLYFNNCCRCKPSSRTNDPEMGEQLWSISVSLIERSLGSGACRSQTSPEHLSE